MVAGRAPTIRFMVSVVIAALSGTASIGTAGLMDALNKADLASALQAGRPVPRVFEVRLAGLDGGTVSCRDGVSLQPSVTAADVGAPDLVVVPGLDDDLAASFAANRGWAPRLVRWHAAGARIASSCTGAFLVADAGLPLGGPVVDGPGGREVRGQRPPHQPVMRQVADGVDDVAHAVHRRAAALARQPRRRRQQRLAEGPLPVLHVRGITTGADAAAVPARAAPAGHRHR
jgi:putative intracellular protease/amidase